MNLIKLLSDMMPSESKQELVDGITAWLNSYTEVRQTVYDIKAMQAENIRLLQEMQNRFDMETHYNDVDSTLADATEPAPEPTPTTEPAPEPTPTTETETG